MAVHKLTVTVGTHASNSRTEVTLSEEALFGGCYLAGDHPERQTTMLHDWCVQWAEQGHGFCYIHPRDQAPRDLLARLPERRLDSVVWIDFKRRRQPDRLDIPPVRRVGVNPFASVAPGISSDDLVTDPVAGRTADWIAACKDGRDDVDWNLTRLLTTVLPLALRIDGLSGRELRSALWDARSAAGPVDMLTDRLGPEVRTPVEHALEIDSDILRRLTSCVGDPLDPFPSNPLNGPSTFPLEDTFGADDIILVTGALPEQSAIGSASIDIIGTYLLLQSVVRRLWEGAQIRDPNWHHPMPLVLDRVVDCSPRDDHLLPEVIERAPETPLVPILSGPDPGELPSRLRLPITGTLDAQVEFTDPTAPGMPSLPGGDIDALEQAIDREQAQSIDSGALCWVSTGTAGRLTGNPRTAATTRPARPGDPPRTRHDADAIGAAITESVTRYGEIPDWVSKEMLREAREE